MTELDDRDRSRLARSGIASAVLWAFVLGAMMFIPPRVAREVKLEEFPVVKLTLNRPQAVTPAAAAKPAASEKSVSSPKPPAPAKSATPSKATLAKTSPAKAAPAKSVAKRAPGDLGIPDFGKSAARQSSAESGGGELVFTGSSDETIAPRPNTARQQVPEFEGKAAVVERDAARSSSVTSRGQSNPAGEKGVSADTERSLSAIGGSAGRDSAGSDAGDLRADSSSTVTAGGTGRETGTGGGSKAGTVSGASSIGAITFEGAPRRLIYPAKPAIVLPERLSRLIDSDRSVTVTMTVAADGSVPASMISFSPAALLPPEVRDFLGSEFSSWRFEQGKGDGQARFLYSIKVQ